MGINAHGLRALCYAKEVGVNFDKTATIGRQRLSIARPHLKRTLKRFRYDADDTQINSIFCDAGGYAEVLLTHLGALEVNSFDLSAFEGATHLHDMNEVLPQRFVEQYSVVFDSGSLEHIFNVPIAVRNCMEMVRGGGHYLSILPANNFFGHGFYQFSPEFFYSVFTEENGFNIKRLIAFEDEPNWEWQSADPEAKWFEVENPRKLRERVTLMNCKPLSLIVIANRVARKPIFAITPQQSDYAAIWAGRSKSVELPTPPSPSRLLRLGKALIPAPIRRMLRRIAEPRPRPIGQGFDRRFFKPMDPNCLDPDSKEERTTEWLSN